MLKVDGQTVERIAATFGATVAAVKGRLRYGLIHPEIRAAARYKAITLDTMKAFADHPSQEVQKDVYDALLQAALIHPLNKSLNEGLDLLDNAVGNAAALA